MEKEKIHYKVIMDLGFIETEQTDNVYFNEHGFAYCIVKLKLKKQIAIYWSKETQLCEMVRSDKKGNVLGRFEIETLLELRKLIYFFSDKKSDDEEFSHAA